ncbi:PREDICTED: kinase D-interacting substrate of 220 kDa-like [Cariama cristata]|uniref:kinase D-interacting substrate of 220 kDa-like n=1 Tax=Cariama cristata TaxID=54380 RepID=UPI000520CA58|nr:PREDICTED: kinase D-interacting substrate of 220 kDa-like [Cariama cristata]
MRQGIKGKRVPEDVTSKKEVQMKRISKNIPTTKDVEPLLEIDGDIRNFEVFLSSRTPVLVARDVRTFLPCTVNLDPKLREIIADVRAARDQMNIGGLPYPTLPLHEAPARATSLFSQPSSACSSTTSFNGPFNSGVLSPQPHSSYYSGMTGPQHPFYNRPFFAPYLYMPRYYPGSSHLISRPPLKTGLSRDQNNGLGAGGGTGSTAGVPHVSLSTMSVDAVCEKLKQIDGLDQSMLPQYSATIRKANINGRVLAQCNIDELKKEMSMNFGDWHLFRSMILEMRNSENQAVQEDPRGATEHVTTVIPHSELTRRPGHNTELPHTELTGLSGSLHA